MIDPLDPGTCAAIRWGLPSGRRGLAAGRPIGPSAGREALSAMLAASGSCIAAEVVLRLAR